MLGKKIQNFVLKAKEGQSFRISKKQNKVNRFRANIQEMDLLNLAIRKLMLTNRSAYNSMSGIYHNSVAGQVPHLASRKIGEFTIYLYMQLP